MAGSNINQNTFLHGELDPSTHGATDSELYNHGLAVCKNTYIQQTGSLFRRAGTQNCWIHSPKTNTYMRKFYTAYDTNKEKVLIAFSLGRIELFSLSAGLVRTEICDLINVKAWNEGFSFQVINYENYLFCNKRVIEIIINENKDIDIDDNIKWIMPQTLSNTDEKKYLRISAFDDERFRFNIKFFGSNNISLTSDDYITFFFDTYHTEKLEHDPNIVQNQENAYKIKTTFFVVCKVIGKVNNTTWQVLFLPVLSSFTDFKILKTYGEDKANRVYKYTMPMKDVPSQVCFYKGRLWLLDKTNRLVHASALNASLFTFLRGTSDADGIVYNFSGVDELYWITSSDQGLYIGTNKGIFVCDVPLPTGNNITFRLFSDIIPASTIAPITVNSSIFFVGADGPSVLEIAKDEINGAFKTYLVSELSQHLLSSGVTSIAYSAYPASVLCCTLRDGTILLMGYSRSSDIYAWTRHELGGNNAHVNFVSTYKLHDRDYFIMDVSRALSDGSFRRSVEFMDNNFHLAPSDKYEFNYLDSSRTSMKKAIIKTMTMGIASTFQFHIMPDDLKNTKLLLTSSDNNQQRIPLVVANWELNLSNNRSLYYSENETLLPRDIQSDGEMYQQISAISPKVTLDIKDRSLYIYISGQFILDKTPVIFVSTKNPTDNIKLESIISSNLNVKKFRLKYIGTQGNKYQYKLMDIKQDRYIKIDLENETFNDIADYLWITLGTGILKKGRDTQIIYSLENTNKLKNSVKLNKAITLAESIPYGHKIQSAIKSDDMIAIALRRTVYTSRGVYHLDNSYNEILSLYKISIDNNNIEKIEVLVFDDQDKALKIIDIKDNKITQIIRVEPNIILNIFNYEDNNNKKFVVEVVDTRSGIPYIAILNMVNYTITYKYKLTENETIIRVCGNLICTTRQIYNIDKNTSINHPLNNAIRCACEYKNYLFIGGTSGALFVSKKWEHPFYRIKHNRNLSIDCMFVNDKYLNCLSQYGEVFQIQIDTIMNFNSSNSTAEAPDRNFHRLTGVSEAQFCYTNNNVILMLGERECVGELVKGEDIFIAQKNTPVLIKDIRSFDKINDLKVTPISNTYQPDSNLGVLTLPVRIGNGAYVYDDTLVQNGTIYFKTYSINALPQFFNETLQVTCDGKEVKSQVVTKDHIHVADGGYVLRCGYGYVQEITTLDLSGGSVKGSSVGLIARQFTLCLRILGSSAGQYSADGLRWYPIPYKQMLTNLSEQSHVYSGIVKMTMPNGIHDINTRVLYLYNNKAEPLNVLSITRDTYVSDN